MRLAMRVRFEIIKQTHQRYKAATKKEKKSILDEFTQISGYSRKYAAWILAHWERKVNAVIDGKPVQYVVGKRKQKPRSGRPPRYDKAFIAVMLQLWNLFDCLCGKRFVPFLRQTIPILAVWNELVTTEDIKNKLMTVSPASIDRLLKPERDKYRLYGVSHTKPGSLLKQQIPLRTFADWDDAAPGFVEADLVGHEGGSAYGDFHCTLTMTDVATGWTETIAVQNKAQKWVFTALKTARKRFPFPLLGIDCDNGSEFINDQLYRYCDAEHLTFTRSRPYRKNDNCFVEQKNNSVVRRAVGYARFDTPQALDILNALYDQLRLMTNLFIPSAKLTLKTRDGAKVIRKHDTPSTPLQRVLAAPTVASEIKQQLMELYARTNPAQLARDIQSLQDQLAKCFTEVHYSTRGQYIAYVSGRSRTFSDKASS
jgi:hypothetical protein